MLTHNKQRNIGPIHVPEAKPGDLVHSVEDAASRVVGKVETVGARTAQRARGSKRLRSAAGIKPLRRHRRGGDVALKTQLAKTSRELAHESSDLSRAVDSLNAVIKANRKAAKRGRTRLIGGLAIGAALMYHFDAEHGRERRAATAQRLRSITGGQPPHET
jgi:hypothetical protein